MIEDWQRYDDDNDDLDDAYETHAYGTHLYIADTYAARDDDGIGNVKDALAFNTKSRV